MLDVSGAVLLNQPELTREIFGNIPPAAKSLFYLLAAVAMAFFCYGCYRRMRLWRLGRPTKHRRHLGAGLKYLFRQVLLQRALLGRSLATVAHILLFSGFVVLFIGTILIAVEHVLAGLAGREATNPLFHHGVYYALYELVMDSFGVAFLVGCLLFMKRRLKRPASVGHTPIDWLVLVLFLVIGVSGYLLEGLRIIREDTPMPGFSFVGLAAAQMFRAFGMAETGASQAHFVVWWFHAVLSLSMIAAFPYSRLFHAVAGTVNIATNEKTLGVMVPVSIEEIEETGIVGVGKVEDFTHQQLLELDACVSCGRCEEACPAFEAGKPLSPRDVVQDCKLHLENVAPILYRGAENDDGAPSLHGDTIAPETLWSCTTCSACVEVCPLGVSPLGLITDMRRYLVGENQLRGTPAQSLQKMQRSGNPWGLPPEDRFSWAEGRDVPTVETNPGFDVLYWVGCAASYDRRIQRIAQSMVKLLKAAKVNFSVLGPEERCTGESARRMGEEFVFQELAESNVELLERTKVKKIVTHCPHCLNSFKKDYPQFGGEYEVVHHSEFLADLVQRGRLPAVSSSLDANGSTTYHDPCYLARVNGVTDAPRQLIQVSLPSDPQAGLVEMARNRTNTSCCGAGGGRMWFDDAPEERIGVSRVKEALATGAKTVAVGCPFCMIMMKDGAAAEDDTVQVRDVAEILADALEGED